MEWKIKNIIKINKNKFIKKLKYKTFKLKENIYLNVLNNKKKRNNKEQTI